MSFAEPILLAGFILIPLAMLAYGSLQRRRRRESSAWANPALVPNLVAARPGWRRHLPPLLLLLALATLVVALARPQRTVAAPQRAANIIMVTDISGSMNATDVHPDRLTAAVDAAKTLTQQRAVDVPARPGDVLRLRRAARRADDRPRRRSRARWTSSWPRAAPRWATASSAGWSPPARRSRTPPAPACAGSRR